MGKINFKEMMDDYWCYPKLSKANNLRAFDDDYFNFLKTKRINQKATTSLYIHIPFCNSGCVFCPYYKLFRNENYLKYIDEYIDAVIKEIRKYANSAYFEGEKITAVHFGGGNPLLLSIEQIGRIVKEIRKVCNIEINEDNWSIEGCINNISNLDYIKGLQELGINKLSFGIQTFKESLRKELNIRATIDEIYTGVELFKKAGYDGYCVDMMYNLPDQSEEDLLEDLKKVDEIDPYHIDLYNLDLSPNTYLYNQIYKKNKFTIKPSNSNRIKLFALGNEWFMNHGYRHIASNIFTKKQKELQVYDRTYLQNGNLIGIGVSSRGYIDGYSYKNVSIMDEYLEQIKQDKFPANLAYRSTPEQIEARTMILFPALTKIARKEIPMYSHYEKKINYIIDLGLAVWDGDFLRLTDKGLLWSGNIALMFIGKENLKPYLQSVLYANRNELNYYNEDEMGKEKVNWEDII